MRILVVEDSAPLGRMLAQTLERAGHPSRWVPTAADARTAATTATPDVVLLDLHLGDGGGAALVDELRALAPAARLIGVSGEPAPADVLARIDQFLLKPVAFDTLLAVIAGQ